MGRIDKSIASVIWSEMELEYDHGEGRCWHGACQVGSEVLIHAGGTQGFYCNRLELDDHPIERVQSFSFGVKTLLRSTLDYVVDHPHLLHHSENCLTTNHLSSLLPRN